MKVHAVLRKDGVMRTFSSDIDQDNIGGVIFNWTEGNYSCDCNRGDFYARAGGEPDPDLPCGHSCIELVALFLDNELLFVDPYSVVIKQ